MKGYALDSDMSSYWIKQQPTVIKNLAAELEKNTLVTIPPFVYYEVKRGLEYKECTNRLRYLADLCKKCPVGDLDYSVIDPAIKIYVELCRKGRNIDDDMDIFIAAWCIVNDFTLVTNNTDHFKYISGLSIVNWAVDAEDAKVAT